MRTLQFQQQLTPGTKFAIYDGTKILWLGEVLSRSHDSTAVPGKLFTCSQDSSRRKLHTGYTNFTFQIFNTPSILLEDRHLHTFLVSDLEYTQLRDQFLQQQAKEFAEKYKKDLLASVDLA